MELVFDVENLKCGGCAHTIMARVQGLDGIDKVSVDIESGKSP